MYVLENEEKKGLEEVECEGARKPLVLGAVFSPGCISRYEALPIVGAQ